MTTADARWKGLTDQRQEGRRASRRLACYRNDPAERPLTTATAWFLGLLLGMRHALEPDHLAAVSTLVTEEDDPRSGLWLGAFWGLGRTLALLGVGLVLALLRTTMSDRLTVAFELLVSVMLLFLGLRALVRARAEWPEARRSGTSTADGSTSTPGRARTFTSVAVPTRSDPWWWESSTASPEAARSPRWCSPASTPTSSGWPTRWSSAAARCWEWGCSPASRVAARASAPHPRARGWTSAAAGTLSVAMGLLWGWPLLPKLLG